MEDARGTRPLFLREQLFGHPASGAVTGARHGSWTPNDDGSPRRSHGKGQRDEMGCNVMKWDEDANQSVFPSPGDQGRVTGPSDEEMAPFA